jgi:hypothetical protein
MRNVNLHLDRFTVLEVRRGQMVPTRKDRPVTFDDGNSFITRIGSGRDRHGCKDVGACSRIPALP